MTKWFRFSKEDMYKVRDRLASLGYVVNSYSLDADFATIKEGRANLFKYRSDALRGVLNPQQITIAEALQLPDNGHSHFNMELSDGKLTSVVNTSYAPLRGQKAEAVYIDEAESINGEYRNLGMTVGRMEGLSGNIQSLPRVKVGGHILCSDPGIKEGAWVVVSSHIDWAATDVDEDDMSDEPSAPFMPPCRCESLLKGHDKNCAWDPLPPEHERERERERERLENVWVLLQPKTAELCLTARDMDWDVEDMREWLCESLPSGWDANNERHRLRRYATDDEIRKEFHNQFRG